MNLQTDLRMKKNYSFRSRIVESDAGKDLRVRLFPEPPAYNAVTAEQSGGKIQSAEQSEGKIQSAEQSGGKIQSAEQSDVKSGNAAATTSKSEVYKYDEKAHKLVKTQIILEKDMEVLKLEVYEKGGEDEKLFDLRRYTRYENNPKIYPTKSGIRLSQRFFHRLLTELGDLESLVEKVVAGETVEKLNSIERNHWLTINSPYCVAQVRNRYKTEHSDELFWSKQGIALKLHDLRALRKSSQNLIAEFEMVSTGCGFHDGHKEWIQCPDCNYYQTVTM